MHADLLFAQRSPQLSPLLWSLATAAAAVVTLPAVV